MTTTRAFLRGAVPLVIVAVVVGACSLAAPSPAPSQGAASPPASSAGGAPASTSTDPLAPLIEAAQQEGGLTTIALPHEWCNYGEMLKTFTSRYGIPINELNADANSGDELEAVKGNKDNRGPQAPDVIDIGLTFAPQAQKDGLLAAYKVAAWEDIPATVKNAEGFWYGDYYGVLAFETNKAAVSNPPTDWADLLKPAYKSKVALAGDPRVGTQAIQTVFAAALANGGSLDNAQPGLDFFKKLNTAGNLLPAIAQPSTIESGVTPVTMRWTYNALAHRDALAGTPEIDVAVPTTGRLADVYVQAISAFAPHPNAAKLWMELLYSNEGQNIWLKGYCNPIRFDAMSKEDAIPADILAKLPDTTGVQFATVDQLNKAEDLIAKGWDKVVGVDVK